MELKILKNYDQSLQNWLQQKRIECGLNVKRIPFNLCSDWKFVDGVLEHSTKRFFSIKGFRVESNLPHLRYHEQPIIDQPEIGILGFLIAKKESTWHWLIQAKVEPGNVLKVQAAPTVQATKSNYEMVHKGLPTPFLEYFLDSGKSGFNLDIDVEQSEQGDRFLNKYNRNCTAIMSNIDEIFEYTIYKWFSADIVRAALLHDFMINTDARSVIFCSDWYKLVQDGETPFCKWNKSNGFGKKLYQSYNNHSSVYFIEEILEKIEMKRRSVEFITETIPLHQLKSWRTTKDRIESSDPDAPFFVQQYLVSVKNREVENWCQPLLETSREVQIVLICCEISGILHFYFRFAPEQGFKNKVQLAPSYISDPSHMCVEWCKTALRDNSTIQHANVYQSDEGGRFMHSIAGYGIYEADPKWADVHDTNGIWLTLNQLHTLRSYKGYLTNEARSLLSILLAWA